MRRDRPVNGLQGPIRGWHTPCYRPRTMPARNHAALVPALLALLSLTACGPALDDGTESREGEPCADAAQRWEACSEQHAEGLEFCGRDIELEEEVWSACMVETCDAAGATRPCDGGQQYCTTYYGPDGVELHWGSACVAAPECTPGDSRSCFGDDAGWPEGGSPSQGCYPDINGVPHWGVDDCNTPLVLSFDRRPIEFSAPTAAAAFDIAGAGACTQPHWPAAATPWLAIDLDHNGAIDGGGELFGTGSALTGGAAQNGFVALAALDSDHDGAITPADARWGELLVWADHDADRRSSPWELLPAASMDLVRIDLEYSSQRRCDRDGNCSVERASFSFRELGAVRSGEVVDVHLACD